MSRPVDAARVAEVINAFPAAVRSAA
jgi:hypothetical protein